MKSIHTYFGIILMFLLNLTASSHAQICKDVTVQLDATGSYTLVAKDIINLPLVPQYQISFSPTYFTCDDIGDHEIKVLLFYAVDSFLTCFPVVTVKDATPPIAKCVTSLHVVLNGKGEYEFTPLGIDQGSTDGCGDVGLRFFPSKVKCTDSNPLSVLMVAQDSTGNKDTCQILVSWSPYAGPTQAIACKDSVVFKLRWEDVIRLTPDMIFQDIQFGCSNQYTIELFAEGNLRPQPIITAADTNIELSVRITDPGNGSQCSTRVIVLTNLECEKPLLICDTKCHSTPLGNCDSGHTDQDEVEWPCDVTITDVCSADFIYPDPEYLIWHGLADSTDAYPALGFEDCLFAGYYDGALNFPDKKIILRHWTVLDWQTEMVYEYFQNITLEYSLTEICDTKPWNAPAGDCASGHTMTDDVEWPADITIHSLFSKPENLNTNLEVQFQNVRPQLNADCNVATTNYQDVVTEINDTTLLVNRTWQIRDSNSQQEWTYTQQITVIRPGKGSMVCVIHENGQPIPNVELMPGVYTGLSGCHYFENPEGLIISPVKDAPLKEGVNIHDLVALVGSLLGHRTLTFYQTIAADVSNSSSVTTLDEVELDQLIKGTLTPSFTHPWFFLEEHTHALSVDISNTLLPYTFIGVKKGDIVRADGEEERFIYTADEVLNAGETYDLPFYLQYDELVTGLGMEIDNPGHKLEFLDVLAPYLPDFYFNNNVHISPDFLRLIWFAPSPYFLTGAPLDKDNPVFILRVKANENVILHDAITLGSPFVNELIPPQSGYPYILRLFWDGVIINSTLDLDDGRKLQFHPNPVSDEMHISGFTDHDQGNIMLFNSVGQIVLRSPLQEKVDMTSLLPGIYFLSVLLDGKYSKAGSVIKH